MLISLKVEFDSDMKALTKSYIDACSTPKPPSQGLNFIDVYLENSFEIADRSPKNDYYVRIPHSKFQVRISKIKSTVFMNT